MATETDIMAALFARLSTFAASPALPVAWPNIAFSPPADQRYLRVVFVPNAVNRLLIGSAGPHQHLGLLQVDVMWTKGVGEAGPRGVAGAIAAHFPCDLRVSAGALRVRIAKRPEVRDLIVGDARVQIPVMVEWEAFA